LATSERSETSDREEHGAAAWRLPRDEEADRHEAEAKARFLAPRLGPRGTMRSRPSMRRCIVVERDRFVSSLWMQRAL
jgi:hypothetical protein